MAAGTSYGRGTALAGTTVNMEFISANPTGPLHLGHTRWAALGDSLLVVGDPSAMEAGVPAFERFVAGFRTLPAGAT